MIAKADPTFDAFEFIAVAKSLPDEIVVVPYVISDNVIRFSPSTKVSL